MLYYVTETLAAEDGSKGLLPLEMRRIVMNIRKCAILLLALVLLVCPWTPVHASEGDETQEEASSISTNTIPGWPAGPEITSTAAVVMETSTNTILYGKNMDHPLYPAAAVKIMTTLLALENSTLEEEVTVTATGVSGATDGGANIAAQLDEVFTMEQCLYAVMMASANDIAMQVAEHVGGSLESFVEMMNDRAKKLGCTGTVFTNPTGLPDENQHVTAHDLALIMKAAMDNDAFCTIAAATSYTIPATNLSGGSRVLSNNFAMLNPSSPVYYEGCLAGKEGYTAASGSTLMCAAKRNDMQIVTVVLQNSNDQIETEAATLMNYAFDSFTMFNAGADDFNLLSGGKAVLPVGMGKESLTTKDRVKNGKIKRTYYYSGIAVGKATLMETQSEDTALLEEGEKNLNESADFSANKSDIPYILIGIAGLILLLLLLRVLIKVIKS